MHWTPWRIFVACCELILDGWWIYSNHVAVWKYFLYFVGQFQTNSFDGYSILPGSSILIVNLLVFWLVGIVLPAKKEKKATPSQSSGKRKGSKESDVHIMVGGIMIAIDVILVLITAVNYALTHTLNVTLIEAIGVVALIILLVFTVFRRH